MTDIMPETFKCASCSAPLEFEGKTMQKCSFCGSTVIVPADLFYRGTGYPGSAVGISGNAERIAEVRRLITAGKKIEAIKVFRETFGAGLKEAKEAVEALERGEGVVLTAKQFSLGSRATPVNGEAVKVAGIAIGGTFLIFTIGALIFTGLIVAMVVALSVGNEAVPSVEHANKATRSADGTSEAPSVTELLRIGGEGTGAGRFKDNRHVAVDGKGRIYSADYSGGRFQVFDREGEFLSQWNGEPGMLLYGLDADRQGIIYMVTNKGIRAHNGETGELLHKFDDHGLRDIAVGLDGRIFAAGRRGISIFDGQLKLLRDFKDAAKDASTNLGFEKIAVDGSGTMFLTDRMSKDIIKFSSEGKFLNRVTTEVRSANDIALDPQGRIYLSDTSQIAIFGQDGRPIKSIDAFQAFGIVLNDAGELYIAARPYILKQRVDL